MLIRIAGIANDSIVDGPGLRLAVFTQGCPHGCPGCHNPHTHDPLGGRQVDIGSIVAMIDKNPLLDGLTLTGGEPFEQPAACAALAASAKARRLSVWAYTGYTYDELAQRRDPDTDALLALVDVLVDGRYVQAQRSLDIAFRGSCNQRLIDMPGTLAAGEVRLWMLEGAANDE